MPTAGRGGGGLSFVLRSGGSAGPTISLSADAELGTRMNNAAAHSRTTRWVFSATGHVAPAAYCLCHLRPET